MNPDLNKELREYAWKYFSIHAEQRLKTFHFFIILATVLVGAGLTVVQRSDNIGYASVLAYLLAFLPFIFWKLDVRNKELIKHGERALMWLEERCELPAMEGMPHILNLFVHEEWKTNKKERFPKVPLLSAHLSYSDCFNAVFFVFGTAGFLLGCLFVVIALIK